ncbi:MAG: hypothetical protein LBI44_03745 [Oscillospiraceae bacterium]|nr:hypothetical protein [Oscillospiraceae bacterium]
MGYERTPQSNSPPPHPKTHLGCRNHCRDTGQLVERECGDRSAETFQKIYNRQKKWNVSVFFADGWQAYAELIPTRLLIQTKSETRLIEGKSAPQRHWFARFRRRTRVVSRSLLMINLSVMPYAKHHVNGSWRNMVSGGRVLFQL